jgi:hypothetical protein
MVTRKEEKLLEEIFPARKKKLREILAKMK